MDVDHALRHMAHGTYRRRRTNCLCQRWAARIKYTLFGIKQICWCTITTQEWRRTKWGRGIADGHTPANVHRPEGIWEFLLVAGTPQQYPIAWCPAPAFDPNCCAMALLCYYMSCPSSAPNPFIYVYSVVVYGLFYLLLFFFFCSLLRLPVLLSFFVLSWCMVAMSRLAAAADSTWATCM